MAGQPGFFDIDERLKELSAKGDALERLSAVVDFESFRADLERAVVRSDRSRGGRRSKLMPRQRAEILAMLAAGRASTEIARIFRVHRATIRGSRHRTGAGFTLSGHMENFDVCR